jgi:glycosyltransferase involved in cell wall biosynthesis
VLHVPYRVAAAWMLRRAAAIICVSQAERDLLRARFRVPAAKISVIHNGIEPGEFVGSAPATGGSRGSALNVLVVGRLERYKHVPQVARAVARLPDAARLVVVGDGPDRQALLEASDEAGLGRRLESLTSLPRDELIARYRQADVFVSLSRQEAFGITLIEAAVAGARVVASDIAPHREVAGLLPEDAVTLVDPAADEEQLADAIREAASRGRVTGADTRVPTWAMAAQRTRAVYQQVLAK